MALVILLEAAAFAGFVMLHRWPRLGVPAAAVALLAGCALAVERNRVDWTTYWNGLKPALNAARPAGLAELAPLRRGLCVQRHGYPRQTVSSICRSLRS